MKIDYTEIIKTQVLQSSDIADEIVNAIQINSELKVYSEIVYYGKSIAIRGNELDKQGIFIWCRLYWNRELNYCDIDIATISIDREYRRQGIMTAIYNTLRNNKYIKKIIIGSVCTKEMQYWCVKNGFNHVSDSDDYEINCQK